jgi:dephospho-CoA kinase
MKKLGLTGGIGTGKSTAADWFRRRGIPVVDSDELARQVVAPCQPALVEIREVFGAQVVDPEGNLRRDLLAEIVFSDPVARCKLEGITHPRIGRLWRTQFGRWLAEGQAMVVAVIPLLFEINAQAEFDATICVACSAWTQRQRLLARGWTAEQMEQRIRAQWSVERKMGSAHYVVWTEGGLENLEAQLERILPGLRAPS